MKSKKPNHVRSIVAHVMLVILSFMCLFFFYILFINATRSHADLQKGFSALPGNYFLENLKSVANDGTFPMFRGILNSLIVSGCSAAIFTFVGSWNNYFVPALVIQSKDKMTVPILIATLRGADYMNFDMGKIYMMILVAIVPIILVYLFLSKYIIAGVTLGGVKE